MKALYLSTENHQKPSLTLSTIPIPAVTPDTVLVKIRAAAINPSDILNADGGFPHTTFPRVPGRDYAGVVADGPSEFLGQEVYGTSGNSLGFLIDGSHAQYCLIPRDSLAPKPLNLSFAQAATVGVPFTTAALALRRANLQSSDVVLVLGASGAVGSAACQLARERGCRVLTATRRDGSDVNLATDPELKSAKTLTNGKGPDIVIDTTGSPTLVKAALLCMATRGRLSYISSPRKGSTDFTFDMKQLYREEKSLIGCNSVLAALSETAMDLRAMKAAFESENLHVPKEDELEKVHIDDAVKAYDSVRNGDGKKYVIVF